MSSFSIAKRPASSVATDPHVSSHLQSLDRESPGKSQQLFDTLTSDTTIPELGNQFGHSEWLAKNPSGRVHVALDANDLSVLGEKHGRLAADNAVKAIGKAVAAAAKEHGGKAWRVSGDKFYSAFDKPAQAYLFLRTLRGHLESVPPAGGVHAHSVSAGVGASDQDAQQALQLAKESRKQTGYAPGHSETHAHSLIHGAAGPVMVYGASQRPPKPIKDLQRSEDEDLRQLLLRKFELELQEMAAVHDNSQRPIRVWRVEDDEGNAPPELAKSFEEVSRLYVSSAKPQLAFLFPEEAEEALGADFLVKSREEGYRLRSVWAGKVWRAPFSSQVIYLPAEKWNR